MRKNLTALAAAIAAHMSGHGLSLRSAAEAACVPHSVLSDVLAGRRTTLDDSTLTRIASWLGRSASDFIVFEEAPPSVARRAA